MIQEVGGFPDCGWGFTEWIFKRIGWNEKNQIVPFVSSANLKRYFQHVPELDISA